MSKPKSFFRVFTEIGPLIALTVPAADTAAASAQASGTQADPGGFFQGTAA